MSRSLNKVQLIGNLTRDPELRYTPQGTAVCSFSVATNRQWRTESGEMRDEAEFHRIVAWDKLAEICGNMLGKGKKVFVEGRLQSRRWTGQDGQQRTTVEIVISDMLLLDRAGTRSDDTDYSQTQPQDDSFDDIPDDFGEEPVPKPAKSQKSTKAKSTSKSASGKKTSGKSKAAATKDAEDDEIPF